MPTSIAVVEDHLLQRTFTERLITATPDLRLVFSGETLTDLIRWMDSAPSGRWPHLVLLDLVADRRESADPTAVRRLVRAGVRVILFSALASPALVRNMLRAGVAGVLSKRDTPESILAAIRTVVDGREWLSPELGEVIAHDPDRPRLSDQEERTLALYASGLALESVAAAIGVKRDTAKKYLQRARDKYAAVGRPLGSRIEMHRVAVSDGLLDPPSPVAG